MKKKLNRHHRHLQQPLVTKEQIDAKSKSAHFLLFFLISNEYHSANKESIRKLKSKMFTATWISIFKKEINTYEGNEFSILGKIARINESVKRQDASWLSALAVCNESVDCKISYKLTIRNKPCVEEQGFYEVMVEKQNQETLLNQFF